MPETEEKPDLDELLELLGETDEPPRRKRIPGSVWLMLALVLSLAGIWLALRTAIGTAAAKILGPPVLPTKVSDRIPRNDKEETVDVVEDYIARCKKGMTEQEVRWIVEDFQKAGLDQEMRSATPEDFIRQRKAQHEWYFELLADGLELDADQRKAGKSKLSGLLDEAAERFQRDIAAGASTPIEHEGIRFQFLGAGVVAGLIDADHWLSDERCAPWELCELTEEQERVTWRPILEQIREFAGGAPDWRDVPSSDLVSFEGGEVSLVEDENLKLSLRGAAPGGPVHLEAAGSVFPVPALSLPAGPADENELIRELRGYHPAQLRTLLLLEPELAEETRVALEGEGE